MAWVIKGKGAPVGKGATVGQGNQGKGKGGPRVPRPSEDNTPWTGPWAVQSRAAPPPVGAAPPPTRYLSVLEARQQYNAPESYHLWG